METAEKTQLFEGNNIFSTRGNGQFGTVTRTGWKASRLGGEKKEKIIAALNDSDVDQVYRKGTKIYKSMLNGNQVEL